MAREYKMTPSKRAVTWFLGRMARLGVGNFTVLVTTGRKSGHPREVTVSPISNGEGDYLVSPYGDSGWVLNARANPSVTLIRGGSSSDVTLVEVDKPQLAKAYYEREGFARQFMDVPGEATVDDFASVAGRFPVFRIERDR